MSNIDWRKSKPQNKAKRLVKPALPPEQLNSPPNTPNAGDDCSNIATNAVALGSCALTQWSLPPTSQIGLFDALKIQTDALKTGDMSNVEEMLYCQAATLQGIFAKLLESAAKRDTLHQQQLILSIAFKAQAQCRATLDTLGNIKNPRMATFVKQANIAQNQLVNNNANTSSESNTRARQKILPIQQNELLTDTKVAYGESMEPRAPRTTGASDSALETVGIVNRSRVARRKISLVP